MDYSGPQWSTLLTEKLLSLNLPIEGVGKNEKGEIIVHFGKDASEQDQRQAALVVAGFGEDLEVAKKKQLDSIMKDFEAAGKAGFDTGLGYRLGATTEDQTEFNKLQTSIALFTGAGIWNADTEISVLDTELQPHAITVGQWQMLAYGYAGFCLQLVNAMGQARAAILKAESAEAAQKVSLT